VRRVLSFHAESCTGCLSCVMNCALSHEGINAPSSARIAIDFNPFEAQWPATYCRQCVDAPCAAVCPVEAIQRHPSLEYWDIDYDLCIGCQACVEACPFDACRFDPVTDKVLKCDTCEGNPMCVRSCAAGALHWRDVTDRSPIEKLMFSS
jgi:anaerobic carbon-monoxide dehydrogenase iron sulfur subunit